MNNAEEKFYFSLHGLLALGAVWGATLAILKYNLMGVVCPAVVFVLPPGLFFLWILKKLRGISFDEKLGRFIKGSHMLSLVGWCASFLPGVFYGLIWQGSRIPCKFAFVLVADNFPDRRTRALGGGKERSLD